MELKYIVTTIIKILISVPAVLLVNSPRVHRAALMGGHLDNKSNSTMLSNFTDVSYEMAFEDSQELSTNASLPETPKLPVLALHPKEKQAKSSEVPEDDLEVSTVEEEIPDPSALVLPGYNLPENIFNKGKPFYLEKDPLTGQVDFDSKSSLLNVNNEDFDYEDEEPSPSVYDKANIDRKDGPTASHKASDVNQLTPNFHDFLNLPVKYNPDKYVYPLISSSYANTKVQGNINKYHNNHKNYDVTTYKPTVSPTYVTAKTPYYMPDYNTITHRVTTTIPTTTSTTQPSTTKPKSDLNHLTAKPPNLMESAMNHPSFEDYSTKKPNPDEIYLTTKNFNNVYLTTEGFSIPRTTTRRTLSLFEQLFGEYDEITTMETVAKPPSLFQNLPVNKNKNKYENEYHDTINTEKPEENKIEDKDFENILTGNDMAHESAYDFEDNYDSNPSESEHKTVVHTKSEAPEVRSTATPTLSTVSTSTTTTAKITTKTATMTSTTTTTMNPVEDPSTDYEPSLPDGGEYDEDISENDKYEPEDFQKNHSTTTVIPITKITSLPLGENHFSTPDLRPPIIAVTHNLKEQLNSEKVVPKPFSHQPVSSSNNIRIAPDQDTMSFVVGNQQNVGGGFVGTSFKEGPYDNSPFRPLIIKADSDKDTVTYTVQAKPEFMQPSFSQNFPEPRKPQQKLPETGGSSVNIHPIKSSEASLSIGVPINGIKKIPGQVVDENLDSEKIEFPKKGTGAKIVFPDEKEDKPSTFTPDLIPPPKQPPIPNREVLLLNSKPMYHQLPSDLTPPSEQDIALTHLERPRPPWDPRPGHFHNGRPEYSRPPRPQAKPAPGEMYKRIDSLPNILPQFRPNAKISSGPHYFDHMGTMKNGYIRQPLLERPSNRPVGFFEKLMPPPPPKNLHNLRKVPILEHDLRTRNAPEDTPKHEQFEFFQHQTPPLPFLSNRRKSEEPTVETLQMIQAKQEKKDVIKSGPTSAFKTSLKGKDTTEKPLYVVYPVNSAPIKLDALDANKKEAVVVGTRAELPLPPSKINHEFTYESPKDRNDSPILKPHPKPSNFPIKSDFPYPLERPDISPLASSFPDLHVGNNLEPKEDGKYPSNNQWGAVQNVESRIVTGSKINYKNPNQISVTLKTYTEKPIAVAYTPTEPYKKLENTEKYSMPNYASPVISEIRPGLLNKADSEITVSAVMHTHAQADVGSLKNAESFSSKITLDSRKQYLENNKSSIDKENMPAKLDFQAPFQASVNVDGLSQGWTVVRSSDKPKIERSDQDEETTTIAIATTSEFDIENFKPQLFGGFKPIYNYPDDASKSDVTDRNKQEDHKN